MLLFRMIHISQHNYFKMMTTETVLQNNAILSKDCVTRNVEFCYRSVFPERVRYQSRASRTQVISSQILWIEESNNTTTIDYCISMPLYKCLMDSRAFKKNKTTYTCKTLLTMSDMILLDCNISSMQNNPALPKPLLDKSREDTVELFLK